MSRTALVVLPRRCPVPDTERFVDFHGGAFGHTHEAVKQRKGFKLTLVQVGRRRRSNGSIAQEVGELPGSRPPTTAVMPSPDT